MTNTRLCGFCIEYGGWKEAVARRPPHRISLRLVARLLCKPNMVYTINRKHGLHLAEESGKKPFAGLKNHSPLEGGVGETRAKPAVEPVGGEPTLGDLQG